MHYKKRLMILIKRATNDMISYDLIEVFWIVALFLLFI
jgi:hypothetical protein